MGGFSVQFLTCIFGSAGIAAVLTWMICRRHGRRRLDLHEEEWQNAVDNVVRTRDRLISEAEALRSTIEKQQVTITHREHAVARNEVNLASAQEKEKLLRKDLFSLRAEREETKAKMGTIQDVLKTVQKQAAELQSEFLKSREFYKKEARYILIAALGQLNRCREAARIRDDFFASAREDMPDYPGESLKNWEPIFERMLGASNDVDLQHVIDGLRKSGWS